MSVFRRIVGGKECFSWGVDGKLHTGEDAYNKALKDGEPKPEPKKPAKSNTIDK